MNSTLYLFFFLLLITREDISLLILPLSVVALLKLREKKFAVITSASALSYFLLVNLMVMLLIRDPFAAAITEPSLEAGYEERLEHLGSLGFKLIKEEDGFKIYRRL